MYGPVLCVFNYIWNKYYVVVGGFVNSYGTPSFHPSSWAHTSTPAVFSLSIPQLGSNDFFFHHKKLEKHLSLFILSILQFIWILLLIQFLHFMLPLAYLSQNKRSINFLFWFCRTPWISNHRRNTVINDMQLAYCQTPTEDFICTRKLILNAM